MSRSLKQTWIFCLNGSPPADITGRIAKIGKEEIVGVWATVEFHLKRDYSPAWREREARLQAIARQVSGLRGARAESFMPKIADESQHLRMSWDEKLIPIMSAKAAAPFFSWAEKPGR